MEILRGLKFFVLMSILLAQFSFYDAYEKLQMTLSEPSSFKPPNAEICTMLKKLENLGYQKEKGKGRPDVKKEIYYYKLVSCSKKALLEVGKELNLSIPGSFGKEMSRKVVGEVSFRHLRDDNGKCKVGLLVNFKGGRDCDNTERKKTDLSHERFNTEKTPIPREDDLSKRRFRRRSRRRGSRRRGSRRRGSLRRGSRRRGSLRRGSLRRGSRRRGSRRRGSRRRGSLRRGSLRRGSRRRGSRRRFRLRIGIRIKVKVSATIKSSTRR